MSRIKRKAQKKKPENVTQDQPQLRKTDLLIKMEADRMLQDHLENIKAEQNRLARRNLIATMGIPMMVLRDEFGYGSKRLNRFMDLVAVQINCVADGYVEVSEIAAQIKQETGFDLKRYLDEGDK